MTLRIGIDAGGTLTKIAIMNDHLAPAEALKFLKFPSSEIERTVAWLAAEANGAVLAFTGGKAGMLRALAEREAVATASGVDVLAVPEFEATCTGARWLLQRQGRSMERFLLTNVGTGTSIHYVTQDGHERVGGTGVGGGTIIGLSALLGWRDGSYEDLVTAALDGDRSRVDLKVSHIYAGVTPPIPGDLTASNFGNVRRQSEPVGIEDALASVVGLVGETVTTVSVHAARERGTADIIYIGSTFLGNKLLADIVYRYTRLRGGEPYVLPDGEYSGAVGALLALQG
ncbi:type II pantothenate kinase [Paenibacillus chartarius]|uniref:Type II pantothenate kinase n=1 Tax=Paenibacillus chartarius TaxID=747481 RepID=A0ABV6DG63_9BACL